MSKQEERSGPGGGGRLLRIVIADNDPALCGFYREAYARLGHEVVGVAQGKRQALELCRTLCPDLLLLWGGIADPADEISRSGSPSAILASAIP